MEYYYYIIAFSWKNIPLFGHNNARVRGTSERERQVNERPLKKRHLDIRNIIMSTNNIVWLYKI